MANPAAPQALPEKPKRNIFAMPLLKKERGIKEMKKRNRQKGSIYLLIAAVFLGVYSVLFLYPQVQAFLGFEEEIRGVERDIENYEVILSDLGKTRDFHKAAYDEDFKEEQDIIDVVYPGDTKKLEVVRLMENFATYLATTYPPFEFTSITFQEPKQENGYTILPFQTSIHSSRANFDRFLGFVNLTGNIDPEAKDHIRLMEISNITLRYRGVDKTGKDQGVDFTVQLNAYSR